jgi:hypothetical protein
VLVHVVTDKDEQDNKDIQHRVRFDEEVMAHDEKSLDSVSTPDSADQSCSISAYTHGSERVGRFKERI